MTTHYILTITPKIRVSQDYHATSFTENRPGLGTAGCGPVAGTPEAPVVRFSFCRAMECREGQVDVVDLAVWYATCNLGLMIFSFFFVWIIQL